MSRSNWTLITKCDIFVQVEVWFRLLQENNWRTVDVNNERYILPLSLFESYRNEDANPLTLFIIESLCKFPIAQRYVEWIFTWFQWRFLPPWWYYRLTLYPLIIMTGGGSFSILPKSKIESNLRFFSANISLHFVGILNNDNAVLVAEAFRNN